MKKILLPILGLSIAISAFAQDDEQSSDPNNACNTYGDSLDGNFLVSGFSTSRSSSFYIDVRDKDSMNNEVSGVIAGDDYENVFYVSASGTINKVVWSDYAHHWIDQGNIFPDIEKNVIGNLIIVGNSERVYYIKRINKTSGETRLVQWNRSSGFHWHVDASWVSSAIYTKNNNQLYYAKPVGGYYEIYRWGKMFAPVSLKIKSPNFQVHNRVLYVLTEGQHGETNLKAYDINNAFNPTSPWAISEDNNLWEYPDHVDLNSKVEVSDDGAVFFRSQSGYLKVVQYDGNGNFVSGQVGNLPCNGSYAVDKKVGTVYYATDGSSGGQLHISARKNHKLVIGNEYKLDYRRVTQTNKRFSEEIIFHNPNLFFLRQDISNSKKDLELGIMTRYAKVCKTDPLRASKMLKNEQTLKKVIYPNPINEIIHFPISTDIKMYNNIGTLVVSEQNTKGVSSINVKSFSLKSGIYIMNLTSVDGAFSQHTIVIE